MRSSQQLQVQSGLRIGANRDGMRDHLVSVMAESPRRYVIDTCIFNKLVDGLIHPTDLPSDGQFFVTHVQLDELNNTNNKERRFQLLWRFTELSPSLLPTESFLFDFSRFDLSKMGSGDIFQAVKTDLDNLNGGKSNNMQDALIAEVAIVNGFTLLTSDHDLMEIATKRGAVVRYYNTGLWQED